MRKYIYTILVGISGVVAGVLATLQLYKLSKKDLEIKIYKYKSYYNTLNQWLYHKNTGKSIVMYLNHYDHNEIGIYGMGELGIRLLEELQNSGIKIKYAVDMNPKSIDCKVCHPEESLAPVDVMIVTAIFDFDQIKEKLSHHLDCKIVSLEEVVLELSSL